MKTSQRFMNVFYGLYAVVILASLVAIAVFKPNKLVLGASILLGAGVLISILANQRKKYLSKDMLVEYIIVGLAVIIVLISAVHK